MALNIGKLVRGLQSNGGEAVDIIGQAMGVGSRSSFSGFRSPISGTGAAAASIGLALGVAKSTSSEGVVNYFEDMAYGTTAGDEAIVGTQVGVGDLMMAPIMTGMGGGIPPRRFMNAQISAYMDPGSTGFRRDFHHDDDLYPMPTQVNRRGRGFRSNVDGSLVLGMNNLKHGGG